MPTCRLVTVPLPQVDNAIDSTPRDWTAAELDLLRDLADLAMTELAHQAPG